MSLKTLRQPISLRTINRLPIESLQDGALHELINLRYTGGALRPVPRKVRLTSPPFKVLFRHNISETIYVLWGVVSGNLAYTIYENGSPTTQNLTFRAVSGDIKFGALGKAITVSIVSEKKTVVFLFDYDSDSYKDFELLLPDMPLVTVQSVTKSTNDEEVYQQTAWSNEAGDLAIAGLGQDQMMRLSQKGYLIGRYMVRFCFELFDGSMVNHSVPQYVYVSRIDAKKHNVNSGDGIGIYSKFTGYQLQYKINIPSGDLTTLKAQYKGIIKSLNVYVTNHRLLTERITGYMSWDTYYSRTMPDDWSPSLMYSWLAEELNYFSLVKVSLENLTADSWTAAESTDTSLISSSEVMTPGNLSPHRLYGESLYPYNQRIFLGNITNKLFPGTSLYGMINPDYDDYTTGADYSLGIAFILDTPEGERKVFSGWKTFNWYSAAAPTYVKFQIRPFIGYPDSRAKSFEVWYKGADQVTRRADTQTIKQMIGLNFSIWIYPLLSLGWYTLAAVPTSWPSITLTIDDTYSDPDRIQATEFENPYYYPALNSYRVDGFVRGMATNAVPLGASQFGQYPIFVFTSRGIWALNIGGGDILIDSIHPLSGKVCNNPKSIIGIDGAVIFMSTEGLMVISGRDPLNISEQMIGKATSPLSELLDYQKIINDPNTYQIQPFLDTVEFETYAAGAIFAYCTVNLPNTEIAKEIIVSNNAYAYSYVYNITSKAWFKITNVWDAFVYDFPNIYGARYEDSAHNLDDLNTERTTTAQEIMVHAETRPMKYGEDVSLKKLHRTLLYGLINPGVEAPFTLYLFGTIDKKNWFSQTASNVISVGTEELILGRSGFSCKQFIIVFGGLVLDDSFVTGIISDIEKRYAGKLR